VELTRLCRYEHSRVYSELGTTAELGGLHLNNSFVAKGLHPVDSFQKYA
jgi:hypothetical protein